MGTQRIPWPGLLVAMGLAALSASATGVESWTANYPLRAGSRVSVTNVQGSISVEAWDRAELELTVTKSTQGESGTLAGVEIDIQSLGDTFRVRTLYPGDAEEPVSVDYRLRVPRQVRLEELRTINGDIRVRNVEGSMVARTLNGHIEGTGVAGSVAARSVNGSVSVALRAVPEAGGRVQLETINGDLLLFLPSTADVELELSTVAGRIESGLLIEARSAAGDTAVRARLGRGGVPARLRTIRGSIYLGKYEDIL